MAIVPASEAATVIGTDENDPALIFLVQRASEAVEKFCNRKFEHAQFTEYHDGRALDWVFVENPPIVDSAGALTWDPSKVEVYDDSDHVWDAVTKLDEDDYRLYPKEGRIQLLWITFLEGYSQNVKLVYYGGYKAAGMPADVKQACNMLIENWYIHKGYRNVDRHGGRGALERMPAPSVESLPEIVADLLEPWRRQVYFTGYEVE